MAVPKLSNIHPDLPRTVRELIQYLYKFDPDSPVRLYDTNDTNPEGSLIQVITVPEDEDAVLETVYIQPAH